MPARVTEPGATLTETIGAGGGELMLTVALPDLVGSAELTAEITIAVDGFDAGAVYMAADVIVPTLELPPLTPFTSQVTPAALVPVTVAVNV